MSLPKIFFQLNLNMKFWSGIIMCVCSLLVVTHCQTSQPDCGLTECNQCLKNVSNIFIHCNKTCHCLESTANISHVCNNETESSETHVANATQSCDMMFFNISTSSNATETPAIISSNGTIANTTSTVVALNVSTSPETTITNPITSSTTSAPNTTATMTTTTATATTNVTAAVTNLTTEATITAATIVTTEAASTLKPTEETGKPESSSTSKPEVVADGRHFDGASFIGGMILAIGLMAISYVGLKFYRSRTENNYHTLREAIHM